MWFVVNKFGGGGGGWSQIKQITFGNELRIYDMIPYTDQVSVLTDSTVMHPAHPNEHCSAWMIGPLRPCCIRVFVIEEFLLNIIKKRTDPHSFRRAMTYCTGKQDRPLERRLPGPLCAMHRRFLSKRSAFFPQKCALNLQKLCKQIARVWNFSKSGGNCARATFRGHLNSERVKLTTICTAAIATLPHTSFPDNNFASCLL